MVEFAAIAASIVLAGLSLFQLALIAGAPIGRFAWGGQQNVLPVGLRAASVVSVVLYVLFALVILAKSGLIALPLPANVVGVGMWVLAGYFCLGIIMNAISRSKPERLVMTPVAAVLAVLFLYVAMQ